MSKTPNSDTTGEQHSGAGTDRRTFLKAAAAGVTAAGVTGTGITGSVAAEPQIPTPQLSVDGNVFVDPEGNTVTLRGLNIIDPRRADTLASLRGKNAVQMVDFVTDKSDDWYAQVIRVPLHPTDIAKRTTGFAGGPATPGEFSEADLEEYLEDHVDDVVDFCEERGVYVILDYHRHWTNDSSEGENSEFDGYWAEDSEPSPTAPYLEDLQEEVVMFWDVVADRYGDRSHTLYEVYNEPTEPGMWGDPFDTNWVAEPWFEFARFIEEPLQQIEEHTDNPILLGSPSWTQSPEGILLDEDNVPSNAADDFYQIDEPENLAMTYHIYPGHDVSQSGDWSTDSGNGDGVFGVYEEYPLVVTEFGWDNTLGTPSDENPLPGTTEDFGDPFIEWMESGDREDSVSWTAWCADIWWDPTMFERSFEGTDTDIENPYEDDIPEDCPDTPCEWELLTGDDHMGDTVKEALEEYADHNNPEGDVSPPPVDDPCEEADAADSEQLENDDWVCDVDGDGNYRDVNADGEVTSQDLSDFFQNQHRDPWDSRDDLFDFNGDGNVGQPDVVDLFQSL